MTRSLSLASAGKGVAAYPPKTKEPDALVSGVLVRLDCLLPGQIWPQLTLEGQKHSNTHYHSHLDVHKVQNLIKQ